MPANAVAGALAGARSRVEDTLRLPTHHLAIRDPGTREYLGSVAEPRPQMLARREFGENNLMPAQPTGTLVETRRAVDHAPDGTINLRLEARDITPGVADAARNVVSRYAMSAEGLYGATNTAAMLDQTWATLRQQLTAYAANATGGQYVYHVLPVQTTNAATANNVYFTNTYTVTNATTSLYDFYTANAARWFTQGIGGWFLAADYATGADTTTLRLYQTPEEIAAAKRRAKAEERKRKIAAKRAVILLKAHLPDDAFEQLEREGYFEVRSLTSGRRYRIYGNSYSRNVVELDANGLPVARLCAHGGYGSRMPLHDHLLAQKLYLETCEDDFRKIANISRIGSVEAQQLMTPRRGLAVAGLGVAA